MATHTAPTSLQIALEQHCERLRIARYSVLFRRGEKAVGMFVVFSGKVSLDFGVDSSLVRTYGAGALVGLPATISGRNYNMTATVTEDAELGFWSSTALDSLLRARPDLCHQLMVILGERMAEHHEALKALVTGDKEPLQKLSANSLRGRKYSDLLVVADCRRAQSGLICDFGCPGHGDRDHFYAGSGRKR